jgi:ribosome-associated translation inhibitor RaiA
VRGRTTRPIDDARRWITEYRHYALGEDVTDTSQTDLGIVTMQINGAVPQGARDYAVEKVSALARLCPRPILAVRISFGVGDAGGASAAASLDVNGTPIRAHADEATLHEAVDVLQARLRTRLVRHEDRRRSRPHDKSGPPSQPSRAAATEERRAAGE